MIVSLSATAQERREVPALRTFGEPASTADVDAIEALIAEYKSAWGREDADALMRLHADDVEWINAYARMFRGSEPLGNFLRERLFPAFDAAVSREEASNMKLVSTRYVGSDAAVVHMYTDGARLPAGERGRRRTHLHLVLERRGESWKIVHTAIMDAL